MRKLKEAFHSFLAALKQSKENPFFEPLPYERPQVDEKVWIQFKSDPGPMPYTIEEFEALMGVTYARHLVFPSKKIYTMVRDLCKEAFEKGFISKRAEWLGVLYRNQIDKGGVKKVSIRWIGDRMGFGLFAEEEILEGEMIGEYTGLVRRCFPFFFLPNQYSFRYPLYRLLWGSYTIDAERFTNEVSFINHSKNPNCESVVSINHHLFHVVIRAKEDIPKGSELSFDYGCPLEDLIS